MPKNTFNTEVVSKDDAVTELSGLRARAMGWRTSKFDPLKQHIQWLDRGKVLRVDEMSKNDVANLRSYIARNITPVENGVDIIVRSSKIDDAGERYCVYISKEKPG